MDDLKALASLAFLVLAVAYGWFATLGALKTGKVSPYSLRHPYRPPETPSSILDDRPQEPEEPMYDRVNTPAWYWLRMAFMVVPLVILTGALLFGLYLFIEDVLFGSRA